MKKIIALLCITAFTAFSQSDGSIAEKTKAMSKKEGFFNFWIDDVNGKVFLEIKNLNQEFLYVNSLAAGLGSNDIGLDRGQLGEERIVFFNKVGKKIMLVQPNYKYRAVSDNSNEKKAVKDSFAASTLWGFTLEAEENGAYLIDMTDFLLRDSHGVVENIKSARQGSYQLNASRSALFFELAIGGFVEWVA